jgi:hypothetical protein
MKWVVILILVVLAVIAVVYLIGYSMPVKHKASITLKLKAPPEEVWNILTDYKSYPTWRSGLENVESPDAKHWTEFSKHGTIQYEAEVFQPHDFFVTRIKNKDLPFGGSWSYELRREGSGTLLQITENGEIYNPIFRFMSKYMIGHEITLKEYAMDISRKINGV